MPCPAHSRVAGLEGVCTVLLVMSQNLLQWEGFFIPLTPGYLFPSG